LTEDIVGIIPAAGQGSRISPSPCSKEIYPVGIYSNAEEAFTARPKVAAHYLLEKMRRAGIVKAYVVLRSGKWDIPAYFRGGSIVDMDLAYLTMEASPGVPFTIDQAYPFVHRARIAFGFPDILFQAEDAFVKLMARQSSKSADLTLGLFPANDPAKEDSVQFDDSGQVSDLTLRPSASHLRYTWGIAMWNPSFTGFLHDYVGNYRSAGIPQEELTAGHAIKAALNAGLRIDSTVVMEEPYLDIGTSEGLSQVTRYFS
jgi:glucose-1-phosphate thymidylyltransferase